MKEFKILFIILVCFFFFNCKKNKTRIVTVSGRVMNLCTDSPIEGVKVYLNNTVTISDNNGLFFFNNVAINSSDKSHYVVKTEYDSGIGTNQILFNGASGELDKEHPENFITLGVSPGVLNLCYKINNTDSIRPPDSIAVYFEQKIFHKNFPNSIYDWPSNYLNIGTVHAPVLQTNISPWPATSCTGCPTANCTGTIWMGKWNITIEKVKSGLHTTTHDSVYVPWKGSATYIVQW